MVGELRRGMKLDTMKQLNDRLQTIESEADRLILDLYRDTYRNEKRPDPLPPAQGTCSRSSRRPSTAAATRRQRGVRDRAEELLRTGHGAQPGSGGRAGRPGVRVHQRFHDTANSIATVVATKVLSPAQAVLLAAGTNLLGALAGTAVAKTIASGLVDTGVVQVTSGVLICALAGATV